MLTVAGGKIRRRQILVFLRPIPSAPLLFHSRGWASIHPHSQTRLTLRPWYGAERSRPNEDEKGRRCTHRRNLRHCKAQRSAALQRKQRTPTTVRNLSLSTNPTRFPLSDQSPFLHGALPPARPGASASGPTMCPPREVRASHIGFKSWRFERLLTLCVLSVSTARAYSNANAACAPLPRRHRGVVPSSSIILHQDENLPQERHCPRCSCYAPARRKQTGWWKPPYDCRLAYSAPG